MISEVLTLSSGTEARLYGSNRYDDIDAARAKWLAWLNTQPMEKSWETWVECWEEYKKS